MAAADYRLMTEATGQRIAIALENLAGFGDYLTTADVVNNLTSTETNKPGSANMLRVINEKITGYTVIQSGTDLNTITENGVYSCASTSVASTLLNCPVSVGFVMLALKWATGTAQIVIGTTAYYRRLLSENWTQL